MTDPTEPTGPGDPGDPGDPVLRARLRAADPAASLPPAAPDGVARLLEETMSHDEPTESRESGARGRGPLTWLVAAAAAVVIAGAAVFVLTRGDAEAPRAVSGATPTTASVTELTAADTPARCMVPQAALLAGKPIAFDGTVDSIEGDTVTLTPTRWYAGGPTESVRVTAPSERLGQLLAAVSFEEGERYLVAADAGGRVMVCGFSGPWTEQLAAMYAEAFPG